MVATYSGPLIGHAQDRDGAYPERVEVVLVDGHGNSHRVRHPFSTQSQARWHLERLLRHEPRWLAGRVERVQTVLSVSRLDRPDPPALVSTAQDVKDAPEPAPMPPQDETQVPAGCLSYAQFQVIREALGLSQNRLAKRLSVGRFTIRGCETGLAGRKSPLVSTETRAKVSAALLALARREYPEVVERILNDERTP